MARGPEVTAGTVPSTLLTPEEVEAKDFPIVRRGFDRQLVRFFLAHVASQLTRRNNRIIELEDEVWRVKEALRSWQSQQTAKARMNEPGA